MASRTEVIVKFKDVENAIFDALNKRRDIRRSLSRLVDDTYETWHTVWAATRMGKQEGPFPGNHSYSTGEYASHINKKDLTLRQKLFPKRAIAKGVLFGIVYNDDDKAHLIEFGTKRDRPGSRSPWGPKTPTPEFKPMRRTRDIVIARMHFR